MRSRTKVLCLMVLSGLLNAAPASAWFGWLDSLSGPGRFRGDLYEVRLYCFGPESPANDLRRKIELAKGNFGKVVVRNIDGQSWLDLQEYWNALQQVDSLALELDKARETIPVGNTSKQLEDTLDKAITERITRLPALIDGLNPEYLTAKTRRAQPRSVASPITLLPPFIPPAFYHIQIAPARVELVVEQINHLQQVLSIPLENAVAIADVAAALASSAVYVSLCDSDTHRRWSLDVGVYRLQAGPDPKFASREDINLKTTMGFLSWRLFPSPNKDVVGIAHGLGLYHFSSDGFDAFSRVIVQPVRFDFHAPSSWAVTPAHDVPSVLRRIAAIPSFRYGWMIFPSGFNKGDFGVSTAGAESDAIPGEFIPTWGFFFNIQPLLQKLGR